MSMKILIVAISLLGFVSLSVAKPVKGSRAVNAQSSVESAKKTLTSTQLAERVQAAYEKALDIQASFSQETRLRSTGLRRGPSSKGVLYLKKPGKMRWEFEGGVLFVSDGKVMWQFDPEEEQVLVNRHIQNVAGVTALNFLNGLGSLQKEFQVEKAIPKGEPENRGIFLKLMPKSEGNLSVQRLILVVSPKTWLANEVYIVDGLGNETHIVLTQMKVNRGIKNKLFTFSTPPGVEVVEFPVGAP